ncbi:DedA family protein [Yinghuangia sp. YIM S09857]|uniref:DedA family protein n=1 Tax=Yinghuangia sp. YIM S09857 TaxID=3436929 RepID=UPI003F53ACF4
MVHDVMSVMPAPLVLLVVGLAVTAESALLFGLVLPGSTLLLTLGLVTRLGEVPLSAAMPVAIAAAVLGGQLAYLRGRHHAGRARPAGRLHATIERAESMVARHGVWSIAIAQWIAGLRTFTPRLAGRARVPYRVFGMTQVVVAAIWASSFVSLGHFAGLAMQQRIGTAASIAGAAVVAAGLVVYAVRRRTARTTAPATAALAAAATPPAPNPAASPTTASPTPSTRTPSTSASRRLEPLPGSWPVGPWMCLPW